MHHLAAAECLRERILRECDLTPVGAPEGNDVKQLLGRAVWRMQFLHDVSHLAVERDWSTGLCIEHRHADRRDFDQRFEISPCLVFGPEGEGIGGRRRGLGGK